MSLNNPTELRNYTGLSDTVIDTTLQLYLDAADTIVSDVLSSSGYTEARKRLIELNLAAHFAVAMPATGTLTGGLVESIRIGQSEERYSALQSNQYGLGTSSYGQIVMALDTAGFLAAQLSSKPLKAKFQVI